MSCGLILPAKKKLDKLENEKGQLVMENQAVKYEIAQIDENEQFLRDTNNKINDSKTKFYDSMTNHEIDEFVTKLIVKYSLKPQRLSITNVEIIEEEVATDSQTEEDAETVEKPRYVSSKKVFVTATGSINSMNLLLDEITTNDKIDLLSYNTVQSSNTGNLNLSIQINMLENIE